MNVESILRIKGRSVLTIDQNATIAQAVTEMAARKVGALVVSDDGHKVDGIISERDVVNALATHGNGLMTMCVCDIMTAQVKTCTPQDEISAITAMMTERRFRHVPVLQDGALVGLVSIGDAVKSRLEEIQDEATSLRSFITS